MKRLKELLLKIYDGKANRTLKKYNLSLYDIRILEDIYNGTCKEFISQNVYNLLNAYKIKTKPKGIGWCVV